MDIDVAGKFEDLVASIREQKPNDRSELDRKYAILLTELEKVEAYFHYYIVQNKLEE